MSDTVRDQVSLPRRDPMITVRNIATFVSLLVAAVGASYALLSFLFYSQSDAQVFVAKTIEAFKAVTEDNAESKSKLKDLDKRVKELELTIARMEERERMRRERRGRRPEAMATPARAPTKPPPIEASKPIELSIIKDARQLLQEQ